MKKHVKVFLCVTTVKLCKPKTDTFFCLVAIPAYAVQFYITFAIVMHNATASDLSSTKRALLYAQRCVSTPSRSDPIEHTMGERNFLWYLGRIDPTTDLPFPFGDNRISGKKFTKLQSEFLSEAYLQGLTVRVIAGERSDATELIRCEGRKLDSEFAEHSRSHKPFNCNRPLAFFTTPGDGDSSITSPRRELWFIVFPSPQYVDQIAELIQAIFDDFGARPFGPIRKNESTHKKQTVEVWHHPELEASIAEWTFFESSLSAYVRHGDVVAIGNVELLLPGMEAVGFKRKFDDWQAFGLCDMFGIQIAVNETSFCRIVLVGVKECYWGEASARFVDALLRAGARHILYGSKAASMNSRDDIYGIRSPGSFSIYSRERENQGLTQLNSTLTDNPALKHLAELAEIATVGIGVTVPTVIGESVDQRDRLNNLNPSTMDDEDGHIARVVQTYNRAMDGGGEDVAFLPIHYISDYIHKRGEGVENGQAHLGITDHAKRNPAFQRIGSFFGVYATISGLREYAPMPKAARLSANLGETVSEQMLSVTHLLNAGMIREAIASLAGSDRTAGLPLSNLQTIALICQKYGFLDDAVYILGILKKPKAWSKLNQGDRNRLKIIDIKILSQAGRFSEAKSACQEILAQHSPGENEVLEMSASLYRRIALAHAHSGQWDAAEQAFAKANEHILPHDSHHGHATNAVFRHIAQLSPFAPSMEEPTWRQAMSSARENYYLAAKSAPVWQANPDKSAIAALFVESALHLDAKNIDDTSGIRRLFAAHLLNMKVGGTERSEGYGELIGFITDPTLKDLFRRAMRMDGVGRRAFQRVPHSMHLLTEVQGVLDVFRSPILKRGSVMNKALNRHDSYRN